MNGNQVRSLVAVFAILVVAVSGNAYADRTEPSSVKGSQGDPAGARIPSRTEVPGNPLPRTAGAHELQDGNPDDSRHEMGISYRRASLTFRQVSYQEAERTEIVVTDSGPESWEINGPVFLRSADPEPPGEIIIKNILGWSTSSGGDDDAEYELEIEWGIVENHELIFELPVLMGDGRIDGNADITLGWHWRLWEEQDGLPAFAMRNFIRIPSGVDSNGVDYEFRGLLTKTVVSDTMRLHLNPFLALINGNNEEDARHFRWGTALGMDYRLSGDLLLVADYIYANGELQRTRDTHAAEIGLDWKLDEHQKIGFATEIGLDGDSYGSNFGAKISYMLSFGG